jgi:hypothetical protein
VVVTLLLLLLVVLPHVDWGLWNMHLTTKIHRKTRLDRCES